MNPDDFESRIARQPLRAPPNQWRGEILRAARQSSGPPVPRPVSTGATWAERLFGPNPLAWAGLAGVWLVLVTVNRGLGDSGASRPTASPPAAFRSKAALAETVREHRRQLAELLGLDEPATRPPGGAPASPKRSEQREEPAMA